MLPVWLTPPCVVLLYFFVRRLDAREAAETAAGLVSVHAALRAWRFAILMVLQMVAFALSVLSLGFLGAPQGELASWRMVLGGAAAAALATASMCTIGTLDRCRLLAAASLSLAAYALVAAGRAPFLQEHFSVGWAATLSHYHSFPTLGLVVAVCLIWRALRLARPVAGWWVNAMLFLWLVAEGAGLWLNPAVIAHNTLHREDMTAALQEVRSRIDEAPPGLVVIPSRPVTLGGVVPCKIWGLAGVFLMGHGGGDVLDGRTVRFAVPMPAWQAARAQGGRVAALLVPGGQ